MCVHINVYLILCNDYMVFHYTNVLECIRPTLSVLVLCI